jgi:hypothetical protein
METTLKFLLETSVRKCTFGKTNTDGKFIDGADFFSETGRIDLLKRMRKRDDHEEFASFINPNHLWDTYLIDLLLDDTGALARAAVEFLEKK